MKYSTKTTLRFIKRCTKYVLSFYDTITDLRHQILLRLSTQHDKLLLGIVLRGVGFYRPGLEVRVQFPRIEGASALLLRVVDGVIAPNVHTVHKLEEASFFGFLRSILAISNRLSAGMCLVGIGPPEMRSASEKISFSVRCSAQ